MTMMSAIGTRCCDARIEGLRAEFGAILAERIIEAEAMDFLWEARIGERYLGEQIGGAIDDDEDFEDVSRIAFLSILDGAWHAGICLIDGEGNAVDLLWKRQFSQRAEAEIAFERAR